MVAFGEDLVVAAGNGEFMKAEKAAGSGDRVLSANGVALLQNLEKAKNGILEEYSKMISSKVTDEELRRAKPPRVR